MTNSAQPLSLLHLALLALAVLLTMHQAVLLAGLWTQMPAGLQPLFIQSDFIHHWASGWLTAHGRAAEVYDVSILAAVMADTAGGLAATKFDIGGLYPPPYLLLVWPLGLLPVGGAGFLFFASQIGLYLFMAWRLAGLPGLLLALASPALWICLQSGQNSLLFASLLGLGLYWLPRRSVLAGVCFGLAALKPHLGLALPILLLVGRDKTAFMTAVLVVAALCCLSFICFGAAVWSEFFTTGIRSISLVVGALPDFGRYISLYPFLVEATLQKNIMIFSYVAIALVGLAAAVRIWYQTPSWDRRTISFVAAALLLAPAAYDYDLPMLVLAMLALWTMRKSLWLVASLLLVPAIYLTEFAGLPLIPLTVILLLWVITKETPASHVGGTGS